MSNEVVTTQQKQTVDAPAELSEQQAEYRSLSQWQLIWIGFRKHKFAQVSLVIVALFYLVAILCQFFAPYATDAKLDIPYAAPTRVRLLAEDGTLHWPFVYGLIKSRDPVTFQAVYVDDTSSRYPIRLFIRSWEYRLLGIFKTNVHLFGVDGPGKVALFGTDNNGRDVFSRAVIATRISTSIGLISIALSLVLGLVIGAASALFGGWVDLAIQKVIEVLISIPTIPLWMGLSAALPREWSPILVYFAVTIILALRGWIGVARVVRGKFLSIREEDYIMASRNFGAGSWYIMIRHMIPNFMSYVIVSLTLSVPWMIIGETSLSYLGIGLRPPVVSWGVLLQSAQNIHSIVEYTWTLIPAIFVIVIVLAFNFVGDGLRDAADPYGRR